MEIFHDLGWFFATRIRNTCFNHELKTQLSFIPRNTTKTIDIAGNGQWALFIKEVEKKKNGL